MIKGGFTGKRGLTILELIVVSAIILLISAAIASSFYAYVKSLTTTSREAETLRGISLLEVELSTNLRRATKGTLSIYSSPPAIYFSVDQELYGYRFDPSERAVYKTVNGGASWTKLPEVKGLEDLRFEANSSGTLVKVEARYQGRLFSFLLTPRVEARKVAWLRWDYALPVTVSNDAVVTMRPVTWRSFWANRDSVRIRNLTSEPLVNRTVILHLVGDRSTPPPGYRDPNGILIFLKRDDNRYYYKDALPYWSIRWFSRNLFFRLTNVLLFVKIPYIPPNGEVELVFFYRPASVPSKFTKSVFDVIGTYGKVRVRNTVARGSWYCLGRDLPFVVKHFDPGAYIASIQDYVDTDPATVRFRVTNPYNLCLGVEKYNGSTRGTWNVSYTSWRSGVWTLPLLYFWVYYWWFFRDTGATPYYLRVEVGQTWSRDYDAYRYVTYYYLRSLSDMPIHLHQLQTYYGSDPAHTRANMDTSSPYTYTMLKIEELADTPHVAERVAFVNLDPISLSSAYTYISMAAPWFDPTSNWIFNGTFSYSSSVGNYWRTISFPFSYSSTPSVIAKISTENGGDNSEERLRNILTSSFDFRIEETNPATEPHPATETISWFSYYPDIMDLQSSYPILGVEGPGPDEEYSYSPNYLGVPTSTLVSDIKDFQFYATIDTATLISSGKLRSDLADLRVLDSDMSTPLPYWIENPNSTSTRIWIRYPFKLPSGASKTIYIVYGNRDLTLSRSNFDSVFTRDLAFKGNGKSDSDLLLWYPFNTTDYLRDFSGNAFNLDILSGTPSWVSTSDGAPFAGSGPTFSSGGYVCLNSASLDLKDEISWEKPLSLWRWIAFKNKFTLHFWIYPESDSTIFRVNDSSLGDLLNVSISGGNLTASVLLYDGSVISLSSAISLNAWHMVDLTFDGSVFNLYLDGVLADSYTANSYLSWGSPTASRLLVIGGSGTFCLDEFALFSRALTGAEVEAKFYRSRGGFLQSFPTVSVGTETTGFSFAKRVPITLNNTGTAPLYQQQVKLIVNTAYLLSKGYISTDTGGNILGLRFTSSDGVSTLPYWVVPGTELTTTTEIIVQLDQIPVGTSTFYMYFDQDVGTRTNGSNHDATLDPIGEAGTVSLNTNWRSIELELLPRGVLATQEVAGSNSHEGYAGSVVILSPLTANEDYNSCPVYGSDIIRTCGQAIARIYSPDKTLGSLRARIEEYPYQNYVHAYEEVGVLRFKPGKWIIGESTPLQASWEKVNGTGSNNTSTWYRFSPASDMNFSDAIMFAQVNSYNEQDYASLGAHIRLHWLGTNSYAATIEEQNDSDTHADEITNIVFIDPISAPDGSKASSYIGLVFVSDRTPRNYDHNWRSIDFPFTFPSIPTVVAKIQTQYGGNNSEERLRNLSTSSFEFKVEESPPFNPWHLLEVVGYIASEKGILYGIKYIPSGRLSYPDLTESYIGSYIQSRP